MKIAILAHNHHAIAQPFAGGLEAHTALVADELVARGHDVTVFAKSGSRTRARLVPIVAHTLRFGAMPDRTGRDRSAEILDAADDVALDAVETDGFDVVLNNSLGPTPYRRPPSLPMLTVLHTPATLDRVIDEVCRPGWQAPLHHRFVAVSETTARQWRPLLGAVGCVPNGIDLARWAPTGRPVTPDLAVWSARITPEKGLPLAVEAARLAGLRLVVSGPISDRCFFEQQVRPLLGDDVRYVGHLNHRRLQHLLQSAAVFLSTPRWDEPFGLAMVEAMAGGTPVAAVPRGAAAEIVTSDAGVLALDETVGALAAAAQQATGLDRDLVRRSVSRFDKKTMIDRYDALLSALAGGRPDADLTAVDHRGKGA
jgi:glycosyltransferase involved in cell wall biosynthesis